MNQHTAAVARGETMEQSEVPDIATNPSITVAENGKRRIGAKSYKIQIQLSEKAKERLFELVERTEADTAAQVVRDALRIYDILIDEIENNGSELMLRSGKTNETVRLRLF